jgi:hypothetical protein
MDFRNGQEQISVLDYKYKQWKYILGGKCQYSQLFVQMLTKITFIIISNNSYYSLLYFVF